AAALARALQVALDAGEPEAGGPVVAGLDAEGRAVEPGRGPVAEQRLVGAEVAERGLDQRAAEARAGIGADIEPGPTPRRPWRRRLGDERGRVLERARLVIAGRAGG